MRSFRDVIPRGLVVSCQASPEDPLHGSFFMARMAVAAAAGGAGAIRADGAADIGAIREAVPLPIIGIRKRRYPRSPVSITPTFAEAREVVTAGAVVVALDATARPRPGGEELADLIERIHLELDVPVLADVSTFDEGVRAADVGADAVASTLSGYVEGSPVLETPDVELVHRLAGALAVPVVAEGRYQTPADAERAIAAGAYALVVGTAITRPHVIARAFSSAIRKRIG